MLRKILNQLWNEKKGNLLIGLELLVVSVFLWYTVDSLYTKYKQFTLPLGFDISHVYNVELGMIPQDSPDYIQPEEGVPTSGDNLLTIMDRLKANPQIEDVCTSGSHFHYRWYNRFATFRSDDNPGVNGYVRFVSSSYFNLFQVKSADGRDTKVLMDALDRGEIVVTQKVAEEFFGTATNAIGKEIECQDQGDAEGVLRRIGAVCENQRYNEFWLFDYAYYRPIPTDQYKNANLYIPGIPLFIRTKAVADSKSFSEDFKKEIEGQLKLGNLYLKNILPMSEIREEHLRNRIDEIRLDIAVVVFFLLNVFLGVIGTFWLHTHHKRGEIGLRMALGATRSSIFGMLLTQGLLLLVIVFIIGAFFFANLWYIDLLEPVVWTNTFSRLLAGMGITFLLLAIMIIAGISFPAYRAMKDEPAEALHYE